MVFWLVVLIEIIFCCFIFILVLLIFFLLLKILYDLKDGCKLCLNDVVIENYVVVFVKDGIVVWKKLMWVWIWCFVNGVKYDSVVMVIRDVVGCGYGDGVLNFNCEIWILWIKINVEGFVSFGVLCDLL